MRKIHLRICKKKISDAKYYEIPKILVVDRTKKTKKKFGPVVVITAGTGDIPIAEESATIAELLQIKVKRIYDVGVAGLHRIYENRNKLKGAKCVIVCAGMEGALASVVAGLFDGVVIAVPVSLGDRLNGFTPLLTMLNSCAPNVACVNINDGIGAGVIAYLIAKSK